VRERSLFICSGNGFTRTDVLRPHLASAQRGLSLAAPSALAAVPGLGLNKQDDEEGDRDQRAEKDGQVGRERDAHVCGERGQREGGGGDLRGQQHRWCGCAAGNCGDARGGLCGHKFRSTQRCAQGERRGGRRKGVHGWWLGRRARNPRSR
jgi:hypothetical protein